ncbi:MAG TPA: iron ABC transporter permease [Gammaproteobacteria bacterium]
MLVALVFAIPVLTVFGFVFYGDSQVLAHLADTVLADYVLNSFWLVLGVSYGTLSIGITCAWLVSVCEFPGRRWFQWMLLLPMAMPAYIIAYTYTGMLDFAGPVQTSLREWFGWGYGDYWFPEIRSLWGAMVMLSLVLYPYVYLLARAAFMQQSVAALEASRTLGAGPWQSFFKVALPMARPAIIAGLSLALMETLADYGTVQYFGVNTFTTGIFRTWYGLGDSAAAAQLSAMLLIMVFALVAIERYSRRRVRYHHHSLRQAQHPRYQLNRRQGWLAAVACFIPLLFGFLLPFMQLLTWTLETAAEMLDAAYLQLVFNSLMLASMAAVLALLLALFMAYGQRLRPVLAVQTAVRISAMGYAIPGTVIAVGVMIPLAMLDQALDDWLRQHWGVSSGLLFSGTVVALMFAYMVRFLAVSIGTVEAALTKIRPSMDDAARSLGYRPWQVLQKIHIPMMRTSLLTAVLMVFVDVLKELPATLILRPFDFNTLAVRAYELASDERLADASTAAVAIVLTGIIPVLLLSRSISRSGNHDE